MEAVDRSHSIVAAKVQTSASGFLCHNPLQSYICHFQVQPLLLLRLGSSFVFADRGTQQRARPAIASP